MCENTSVISGHHQCHVSPSLDGDLCDCLMTRSCSTKVVLDFKVKACFIKKDAVLEVAMSKSNSLGPSLLLKNSCRVIVSSWLFLEEFESVANSAAYSSINC